MLLLKGDSCVLLLLKALWKSPFYPWWGERNLKHCALSPGIGVIKSGFGIMQCVTWFVVKILPQLQGSRGHSGMPGVLHWT